MPVDGAARFVSFETQDVRFPTSAELDGSDAMNPDPDYSAAYVIVRTDASDGVEGHGFAFTIGRGNDIQVAAIEALAPLLLDRLVSEVLSDMGAFSRTLTGDSQLRWLGPDKGVGHMAAGAVLNAVWDLYAKREGKPLWKLLSDLEPEEIVDLVDFRYIADALTPEDALALLRRAAPTRAEREELLLRAGVPAYATSPGWLGYSDDRLRERCRAAVEAGFDTVKLKVGRDIEEDVRRIKIAREVLGPDVRLMVDANQRWGVQEAIASIQRLAPFDLLWVEEPTHPDDVLGHAAIARAVAPVRLATGEHVANRIVFKQLLQAGAIGFCQIDAARVAGVNENIAILLLAAKHGVPVCPHAGGVGLCELVQHLAMFDLVAVGGHHNERVVEYVDHLHEHFVDPVVVAGGRYRAPTAPGFSSTMLPESLAAHRYPDGTAWSSSAERATRSAEPALGRTQR